VRGVVGRVVHLRLLAVLLQFRTPHRSAPHAGSNSFRRTLAAHAARPEERLTQQAERRNQIDTVVLRRRC
jgi:hypothetical protein